MQRDTSQRSEIRSGWHVHHRKFHHSCDVCLLQDGGQAGIKMCVLKGDLVEPSINSSGVICVVLDGSVRDVLTQSFLGWIMRFAGGCPWSWCDASKMSNKVGALSCRSSSPIKAWPCPDEVNYRRLVKIWIVWLVESSDISVKISRESVELCVCVCCAKRGWDEVFVMCVNV